VEWASWISIAVIGAVMLSELVRWTGTRVVATLQALTPQLTLLLVPIAGIALLRGQVLIAVAAGLVGLLAQSLMAPIISHTSRIPLSTETAALRVALANLLYGNEQTEAVAQDLAGRDLDIIVFNEYTPEHQEVLLTSALADDYPFKVDRSEPFAGGIAIWSRHELDVGCPPETFDTSLNVCAETPDGSVQIVAVHPRTPIYDFKDWNDDLLALANIDPKNDVALLLLGDFNATYWHPRFRHFLRNGYTDAHIAAGHALSASWPTDKLIPPFVRLDHALTAGRLISTDVEDFDIPGSDHRGFVVTVAPTP
jgi:endonuclease/exonuclease/phosphatase (EEP) superfamily protein YafD